MNQRVITIAGSGLLVLAVGLGVYLFSGKSGDPSVSKDPGPDRKDASATTRDANNVKPTPWLERLASTEPATVRAALAEFDAHKGEVVKAIPVLTAHLSQKDAATRSALSDLLARLGQDDGPGEKIGAEKVRTDLIAALTRGDVPAQSVAALTVAKLGKASRTSGPATDALAKALLSEDRLLQGIAALALKEIADPKTPPREATDERTFAGKWVRFVYQGYLNSEDTPLVPPLIAALQDPDPALQAWAAAFFGNLGDSIKNSGEAIPALTQVFKGSNEAAARAAAGALGKLSFRESSLAGTLAAGLNDPNPEMRRRTALALAAARRSVEGRARPILPAGLQTPETVTTLTAALEAGAPEAREQIVRTLGGIGVPAAKAVPALLKVAGSTEKADQALRLEAIRALGNIAAEPGTVVPALLKALKDADADTRQAAGVALASFPTDALPGLRQTLTETDSAAHAGALLALGAIGAPARAALPDITPLLKAEAPQVRVLAATALQRIDPGNKEVVPVLQGALGEKTPAVRYAALEAVALVGPPASALTSELATALEDDDKHAAYRAADALAAIGPGAVKATEKLAAVIQKYPDTKRDERVFVDTNEYLTQRAIEALRAIGPAAKDAAPALVAVLAKGKDLDAADTLSILDPTSEAGLPTLIEAAQSPYVNHSEIALRALGRLGALGKAAVPSLIERLADAAQSETSREALLRLGPGTVPALIAALADRNQQLGALVVLARLGPAAQDAVPALLKMAEGDLAPYALTTLAALGEPGVTALLGVVKDPARAAAALQALATLEDKASAAVKPLSELLKENSFDAKAEALRTLAAIGPEAKAAAPVVKELLTAASEEVQAAAALALVRIADDGKTAGPVLLRMAQEAKNRAARRDAVHGLGLVPAEVKESLPLLQKLLKDPDFELRMTAATALAALGKEGVPAIAALAEALTDKDASVQVVVCQALAKFGKDAKDAVPALAARLKDKDLVLLAAAEALGTLGPVAKDAAPALREAIQAHSESGVPASEALARFAHALYRIEGKSVAPEVLPILVRQLTAPTYPAALVATIDALGDLGDAAHAAVPALAPGLESIYQSVRRATATTLGKIGPAAKSAVPWLQRAAAQSVDPELSRQAKEALAAIQKG